MSSAQNQEAPRITGKGRQVAVHILYRVAQEEDWSHYVVWLALVIGLKLYLNLPPRRHLKNFEVEDHMGVQEDLSSARNNRTGVDELRFIVAPGN